MGFLDYVVRRVRADAADEQSDSDSPHSHHDSGVSDDNHCGSEPGSDDDPDRGETSEPPIDLAVQNRMLKRQLRTAPARAAKARKKVEMQRQIEEVAPTWAEQLQWGFFTQTLTRCSHPTPLSEATEGCGQTDSYKRFAQERARCVWSFLKCLKDKVITLFQDHGNIQHALNTCVADDTTTKLRPATTERCVGYTVMNTFQFVHMRSVDGRCESLHIPTPMRCLTSGNAECIYEAFKFWMVSTASGMGSIWSLLGCPSGLLQKPKWKTIFLMGDALKANDKAWKVEKSNRVQNPDKTNLGLRMKCGNHQLSLVRRPAVLSVEKFWCTVVRLGNLMETHSFRRAFAAAFVSLLHKDGQFVRSLG